MEDGQAGADIHDFWISWRCIDQSTLRWMFGIPGKKELCKEDESVM